jgi:hypothetical protein
MGTAAMTRLSTPLVSHVVLRHQGVIITAGHLQLSMHTCGGDDNGEGVGIHPPAALGCARDDEG